jgi:hypothetical protein
MSFFERVLGRKRNKKEKSNTPESKLTPEEIMKLTRFFNALVLNKRKIEKFDPENLEALADKILEEYFHFFQVFHFLYFKAAKVKLNEDGSEKKLLHKAYSDFLRETNDLIENKVNYPAKKLLIKIFLHVFDGIKLNKHYYCEYAGTPKISKNFLGINCVGFIQILGAILLKTGFEVKLAMGINHPFCLVTIGEDTFCLSLYGVTTFPGRLLKEGEDIQLINFNEHDKNSLFGMTENTEKLFFVTDFKQGVIYQILESFRFYQDAMENEEGRGLGVLDLSKEKDFLHSIKPALEGLDLKKIQKKLFPVYFNKFLESEELVEKEYEELSKGYEETLVTRGLNALFESYSYRKHNSDAKPLTMAEYEKLHQDDLSIFSAAKELYPDELLAFFENDKPLPISVPILIQNSYAELKDLLGEYEDKELAGKIKHRMIEGFKTELSTLKSM